MRAGGERGGHRLRGSVFQGPHLRRVVEHGWVGRREASCCRSNHEGRPSGGGGRGKTRGSAPISIYGIPWGYLAARGSAPLRVYSRGSSGGPSSTLRDSDGSRCGLPAIDCRSGCRGGGIGTFGNPARLG